MRFYAASAFERDNVSAKLNRSLEDWLYGKIRETAGLQRAVRSMLHGFIPKERE